MPIEVREDPELIQQSIVEGRSPETLKSFWEKFFINDHGLKLFQEGQKEKWTKVEPKSRQHNNESSDSKAKASKSEQPRNKRFEDQSKRHRTDAKAKASKSEQNSQRRVRNLQDRTAPLANTVSSAPSNSKAKASPSVQLQNKRSSRNAPLDLNAPLAKRSRNEQRDDLERISTL